MTAAPRPWRWFPPVAALAILMCGGCAMHNLARTVGAKNGELRASVGGPVFSNLGAPIPIPNAVTGGRYGLTDNLDIDGNLSLTGTAYGIVGVDAGVIQQIVRRPRGFALSISARGHFLTALRGPDFRAYPELGLHAETLATPWLTAYGGATAFVQFAPPSGKPPVFAVPYVGTELLLGRTPNGRYPYGIALEVGWISPWQDSTSVVSWEPAGHGAVFVMVGTRVRLGDLDR